MHLCLRLRLLRPCLHLHSCRVLRPRLHPVLHLRLCLELCLEPRRHPQLRPVTRLNLRPCLPPRPPPSPLPWRRCGGPGALLQRGSLPWGQGPVQQQGLARGQRVWQARPLVRCCQSNHPAW